MHPIIGLGLVGLGLVGVAQAKKPSMALPVFRPGFGWFKIGRRPTRAPQSGNGSWLQTSIGWVWYPAPGTMLLMNGNVWVANTMTTPAPPPGANGGSWRPVTAGPGPNRYWTWTPTHRGG
jgi:hypothetical protein